MDTIDVILARAKSFTGETKALVNQAQQAMSDANSIIETLTALEDDTQLANEAANAAADKAAQAAAEFDDMKADIETAAQNLVGNTVDERLEEVNSDIEELQSSISTLNSTTIPALENRITAAAQSGGDTITIADENTNAAKIRTATIDNKGKYILEKNYTSAGSNEDGSMTQKAIKDYVDSKITGGGGATQFDPEKAGNIVVIGEDGTIMPGTTSEEDIIEALIKSGSYTSVDGLGLQIDYENKSFTRTQEATNATDFNDYLMYGGRMRCNVADNGVILAFYGDSGYRDDGSNGQVMVYQPKFYYRRIPITTNNLKIGKAIKTESIVISATPKTGFKLHPLFIDNEGNELEYVLLSAYEGCTFDKSANQYNLNDNGLVDFDNDMLSSIAGAKPISGYNTTLTIENAEKLATNRGEGWHITNMAAESANQMLEIIEFGLMNGQEALEKGICNITSQGGYNCSSITGSTASLGNSSGAATSTTNEINGNTNVYTDQGRRAISYRGQENPWGNMWKMIGGTNIYGNGTLNGGIPYICSDFNYSSSSIEDNYESVGFCLPSIYGWVSAMGYGNSKYDWVFLPASCESTANSAAPVGDNLWSVANLNNINIIAVGGHWAFGDGDGPFYYACDKTPVEAPSKSYGARLMFIPKKNSIYNANYTSWKRRMGV